MQQSKNININSSPLKLDKIMKAPSPQANENETKETDNEPLKVDLKNIPAHELESIENSEAKQKLIFTIQKYQDSNRFGKIVKYELGFKESFVELSQKSESELENILHRIRSHLDNKNLDKFYENMATSLAITYEQAMSTIYPIDGFSDMLLDNEDFWNSYERYRIESNFPSVDSTTQMMFMIVQTTVMAHHFAMNPEEHDAMEAPPPLETILEGIEPQPTPPRTEIIITDDDDTDTKTNVSETQTEQHIPPVSLGQRL